MAKQMKTTVLKRTIAVSLIAALVLTGLALTPPGFGTDAGAVYAASNGVQKLREGTEYTFNSSKTSSHTISYTTKDNGYNDPDLFALQSITLTIDGKQTAIVAGNLGKPQHASVDLYAINSNVSLIEICGAHNDGWHTCDRIYRYDGKTQQLVFLYDFARHWPYTEKFQPTVEKVGNNKIILKSDWDSSFLSYGSLSTFTVTFKYKSNKIKSPKTGVLIYKTHSDKAYRYVGNKWTALRKVKTYKSAGGKKAAFTVKKGDVVKINQIKQMKNKVYLQVQKDKKKGWFRDAGSSSKSTFVHGISPAKAIENVKKWMKKNGESAKGHKFTASSSWNYIKGKPYYFVQRDNYIWEIFCVNVKTGKVTRTYDDDGASAWGA